MKIESRSNENQQQFSDVMQQLDELQPELQDVYDQLEEEIVTALCTVSSDSSDNKEKSPEEQLFLDLK